MDGLQALNAFPQNANPEDGQRILWESSDARKSVSKDEFIKQLSALKLRIESGNKSRWLLYSEHPARFAMGLLALAGLKKPVVLSANKQSGWLNRISDQFDAILSDEAIESGNLPVFDFDNLPEQAPRWWPELTGKESLVFLTSGSTGDPKLIHKPLLALTNEINGLVAAFKPEKFSAVYAASVSHLHIYGLLFRLLLPLVTNCRSIIEIVEYHEQLHRLARHFPRLIFVSSPAFLSRIDTRLPDIQLAGIYSSGGPLNSESAHNAFQKMKFLPIEIYGSTETGGIAWRQQETPDTTWRPFAGVKLTQREHEIEIVSPNMPGEPPYLLDDKIRFLANGMFMLQGRKDRIAKIEEKRISLTEIEQFLESMDEIRKCVALVTSGHRRIVVCAIQLSEKGLDALADQREAQLIQHWKQSMRMNFEAVTIPRKWRFVEEIPLNTQGKIDNQSLLKLFQQTKGTCR